MTLTIHLPMKLKSEANTSEHWAVKKKRVDFQKLLVRSMWNKMVKEPFKLPVKVTLTRLAKMMMDDDNLVSAFKYVRDEIADLLKPGYAPGRSDGEGDILFAYKQQKNKEYWIIIQIEEQ